MGSEFDPALFLCQADQSLKLLLGAAKRVDKGFRFLRSGRLIEASKEFTRGTLVRPEKHRNYKNLSAKDLASAQLELSYGWLPLLSDAYNGAQYIGHLTQLPQRTKYRARCRRVVTATDTLAGLDFETQKSHVIGQLIAHMEEDFAFSSSYLVGFDDPLSMAWERLPYSFVADWFVPVQNYLMARGFARQVKGTFETVTGYDLTILGLKVKTGYSGTYRLVNDGNKFHSRSVSISRSISTSLAVPYPKPKSLLSVPSWRRALNAVSLLVQKHGSTNPAVALASSYGLALMGAKVLPTALADHEALNALQESADGVLGSL